MTSCQELVGYLEDVDGAAEVQREIASIAMTLKDTLHAAEIILDKAPERYVYAASLSRKNDRPTDKLEALLVNVGDALCETLYSAHAFGGVRVRHADRGRSLPRVRSLVGAEFLMKIRGAARAGWIRATTTTGT